MSQSKKSNNTSTPAPPTQTITAPVFNYQYQVANKVNQDMGIPQLLGTRALAIPLSTSVKTANANNVVSPLSVPYFIPNPKLTIPTS